jgi:1-acyl-sn-glycerol-3-phosphate acyltransferase
VTEPAPNNHDLFKTTKMPRPKKRSRAYFVWPSALQRFARLLTKPLFKVFARKKVFGREQLKGLSDGVILAPNHISFFDVALVPSALPFFSKLLPVFFVSRPHTSYEIHEPGNFVMKSFLSESWGSFEYIPGQRDYAKTLANHAKILEAGGTVCIFPEGGISKDGGVREAKGGVAYLACKTGKPVVPVKIEGSHHMTFGDLLRGKRRVRVVFGEPICFAATETQLADPEFLKAQAAIIRQKIIEL